ncbi:hypothetical protein FOA52_012847 [Chlamydomonas sp. UWO 241]|nr:hypothetical protein FOA52_012847 [Chlamydomonas sp. UWO 241]
MLPGAPSQGTRALRSKRVVGQWRYLVAIPLLLLAYLFVVVPSKRPTTDLRVTGHSATGRFTDVSLLSEWASYEGRMHEMSAGVFTPFAVAEDRATMRLLASVLVLQDMGFWTTLYVLPSNTCQNVACVLNVAERLGIAGLETAKIKVMGAGSHPAKVHVYIAFGNHTVPNHAAIGQINLYMLMYPFEPAAPTIDLRGGACGTMARFDNFLLESSFTASVFNTAMQPTLGRLLDGGCIFPQFDTVSVAVTGLVPKAAQTDDATEARRHIVVLGDFVDNGGHARILQTFKSMLESLPTSTNLLMIGKADPGQKEGAAIFATTKLAELIKREGLQGRVGVIVVNMDWDEEIKAGMQSALVLWVMDGVRLRGRGENVDEVPGSNADIVRGMSAGCIPIAMDEHGSIDPIVHGRNGFVAKSVAEFQATTLSVFESQLPERMALRQAMKATAGSATYDTFEFYLERTINRGILTRPLRYFIKTTLPTMRWCALGKTKAGSAKSDPGITPKTHAAVIIEGRCHYALEYVILNAMSMLTAGSVHTWILHIYHTTSNDAFIKKIVSDHPSLAQRTVLHNTNQADIDIPAYNHLLKSPDFWRKMAPAEKCLIFQTDSIILTQGIDEFLSYDYIGAPWHKANERWDEISKNSPEGVGNGGFSVRDVAGSLDIAIREGSGSPDNAQEDMFFAHHMTESTQSMQEGHNGSAVRPYIIAPRAHAYKFCLEVICSDIIVNGVPGGGYDFVPMALHAGWYYNPVERVQSLLDWSLRYVLRDAVVDAHGVPKCIADNNPH